MAWATVKSLLVGLGKPSIALEIQVDSGQQPPMMAVQHSVLVSPMLSVALVALLAAAPLWELHESFHSPSKCLIHVTNVLYDEAI